MKKSKEIKSLKNEIKLLNEEIKLLKIKSNEELQRLGIANNTIKLQIDENVKLNRELNSSLTIQDLTEKHLKIAESEIKRLNVIINYLEMKDK